MTTSSRSAIAAALSATVACTPTATPSRAAEREPSHADAATSPVATATASATASATTATAAADPGDAASSAKVPDIEYVPTPMNVVEKMLDAAKIKKDDVLYDLGCGDGRIVVEAAKRFGVHAKGFDVDPVRIAESRANVAKAKVEHLVTIEQKDIFDVDLTPASVVTLYLLPELNVRLIPQLEKLAPGSRIVSHDFDMAGVDPEKWWTVMAPDHRETTRMREHYVYLWRTPLKKTAAKKGKN